MMSKRTNLIVIGVILFAMAGLPVVGAIQSAMRGSGSIDNGMEAGVEAAKKRLPLEIDAYQTLLDVRKDGRNFVYDYEVKVDSEKLLKMRTYFEKQNQFEFCASPDFRTYLAQNIRTVAQYKTTESDAFSYTVNTDSVPCDYARTANGVSIQTFPPHIERDLNVEYLEFFLPMRLTNELSIVSLFPPHHGVLEYNEQASVMVGEVESLGQKILEAMCDKETEFGTDDKGPWVYVKPRDRSDPILRYKISDRICRENLPEFKYVNDGDLRSLAHMREFMEKR